MQNHEIEQGARLEQIISMLGLTQKAFAQRVNVAQSFVTNMIRGKKGISARVLNGLTENYPQVNIAWLLTGEGEMFLEKKPDAAGMVEEGGERYEASPAAPEPPALVVTDVTPLLRMMEAMREEMRAREAEMKERIEWLERRVRELEAERDAVVSPI